MPGRILQADTMSVKEKVTTTVPRILDQVQSSSANHQKNLVALYKAQTEAAEYTETVRRGKGIKLVGERIFEEEVLRMLMLVLPVKKGTAQADRIIKFIGAYIKFVNLKAVEDKETVEEEDDDDDTMASRFTARLLKHLLKGFIAKDKSVRYRVLQTVAEMVSHLGEVDEEIYKSLRAALLDRINDKEPPVRMQAAIALSKLCGSEDPSEVAEGEQTIMDILIDILAYDTSAEVRRAVLLNIPITPITIPHILDRTRDTDTSLRKLVYSRVLSENITNEDKTLGPLHPRGLSIAQRELIVRNGLGDREQSVRAAAASLLATWVDENKNGDETMEGAVVALLQMFDLHESTVATDVLLSIFVTRPEIYDNINFEDGYWTSLTPETAFLARVFVDHGRATKDDARLEAILPVVTALAFRLQEAYNQLIEDMRAEEEERIIRDLEDEEKHKIEDERLDKEFIIGEMLRMAVDLDYSDEIGRRKMFQLVRDMLSQEELPESLVSKCLDVLRELSTERDLIRVVVEIIQDLRDTGDEDEDNLNKDADAETNFGDTPATVRPQRSQLFNKKAVVEKTLEEQARADEIDLRCLSLCVGMLERVNSTLDENSTLHGILRDLIVPSANRKELAFQEKGLISLGLCCLIDRRLALTRLQGFLGQIMNSPEPLKYRLFQVVFDVLMVHENDFLKKDGGDNAAKITEFLTQLLGSEKSSEKIKALLCVGISKLVLSGMITDVKALKNLIVQYLSPATIDNQELRQCLTFFFPAYCHSSSRYQQTMREIFIDMFEELNEMRNDLEEEEEMISSAQIGAMFVDWTDPLRLSNATGAQKSSNAKNQADEFIHLQLAGDIFRSLLKKDYTKEEKKVLCQLLNKLHIPETVDDDKIRELKLLMHNLRLRRPPRDPTTRNAFTKFETAVCKKFEKQLEDFDESEYRKLEQLQDLFDFLDDIIPDDDDEVIDIDLPKKKGKKRRSGSVTSMSTENDREDTASATSSRKSKARTKRQRFSTSDAESDDDIVELPPPSSAPTRTLPKRSAATKKPIQIIEVSSDSDEEQATPVPRKSRPKSKQVKEEIEDDLVDEDHTFDSIIDGESEDEEDEVNDLLAEE